MKKALIIALLILTGCATAVAPTAPLVVAPSKSIYIDSALLRPCRSLVSVPPPVTFENVLTVTKTNTSIYVECRNRMNAAIVVLKKFSNLNP